MTITKYSPNAITLTLTPEQASHLQEVADGNWDVYLDMGADDVDDGDMSEQEIQDELERNYAIGHTLRILRDGMTEILSGATEYQHE